MSFRDFRETVEGVRKVKWDGLWHVLYRIGKRDTYDRVTKSVAMSVMRNMHKWNTQEN